jgi:hypothetical protein
MFRPFKGGARSEAHHTTLQDATTNLLGKHACCDVLQAFACHVRL